MTNPTNTTTANATPVAEAVSRALDLDLMFEMNASLHKKGCGFTVNRSAIEAAPQPDVEELLNRIQNRFVSTFGSEEYDSLVARLQPGSQEAQMSGETAAQLVNDIIELADDHQLSIIYSGTNAYTLMTEDLEGLEDEQLVEVYNILNVEPGHISQTYLLDSGDKLDKLVSDGFLKPTVVRGITDDQILAAWEQAYPEPEVEEVEEVETESSVGEVEVFDTDSSGSADTYQAEGGVSREDAVVLSAVASSSEFDFADDENELVEEVLEPEVYTVEEACIMLAKLQEVVSDEGLSDQGIVVLPNGTEVNLDQDTKEIVEGLNLDDENVSYLGNIISERIELILTYINASIDEPDEDEEDFEDEDFDSDDYFDDEDLDEHLANPQFDEYDRFVTPVNIANNLIINFPIDSTVAAMYADESFRKGLNEIEGSLIVTAEDGTFIEEVKSENVVSAYALSSKKSDGWLLPALRQVVTYLNSLTGSALPTIIASEVDGVEFASSLGDSIGQVLQVLPDRACFGNIINHGGISDFFDFNNYLTVNTDVDVTEMEITNHFSVYAPVLFHPTKFEKVLASLHRAVESRAQTADFSVVETFTIDAVDACGEYKHYVAALLESGFEMVSRSEANAALEAGETLDAFETLSVDINDADQQTLDILFAGSDILMYKEINS